MLDLRPGRSYLFRGDDQQTDSILAGFSAFDQVVLDATDLDVKALRAVVVQAQLAAAEKRLILIKNADQLSDVAQNTLLKLLEEPPTTLVMVLQTLQDGRLLATVTSRLHRLEDVALIAAKDQQTIFQGSADQVFDQLTGLAKKELIEVLASEMTLQRQALLKTPTIELGERIKLLDLAVKKLQANTNVKLTIDWLLLRWNLN